MNIDTIVEKLVAEKSLNAREALDFVEAFFSLMKEEISSGKPCSIPGFGRFKLTKASDRYNAKKLFIDDPDDGFYCQFLPHMKLKARVSIDFDKP